MPRFLAFRNPTLESTKNSGSINKVQLYRLQEILHLLHIKQPGASGYIWMLVCLLEYVQPQHACSHFTIIYFMVPPDKRWWNLTHHFPTKQLRFLVTTRVAVWQQRRASLWDEGLLTWCQRQATLRRCSVYPAMSWQSQLGAGRRSPVVWLPHPSACSPSKHSQQALPQPVRVTCTMITGAIGAGLCENKHRIEICGQRFNWCCDLLFW